MPGTIICELAAGIMTITLNRPDKLNAVNYEMVDSLLDAFDTFENDSTVGAIILTGAGERAFSAGADIREFSTSVADGPVTAIRDFVRRGQTLTARMEAFNKPIIAAVNGIAFGAGCEITEAVHLAIASDRSIFAKPEIKLGMLPTFGGTQRLPRLAGRKRALEHLLTGETFGPERALWLGLVNSIVPHDALLGAARDMACRIMRHSPLAVASVITAVTRGINVSIAEGLQIESEQFGRVASTSDLREGLNAWMQGRPAIYSGV